MTKLKSKINRFFFNHRDSGIPNLMLIVAAGNVVVFLLSLLNREISFASFLNFNPVRILRGEVWRLLTYIFTYLSESGNPILGVIGLIFYVWGGKVLEQYWGRLRFNAYYFLGILLTDAAALALGAYATSTYVNLSIFLAMATVMPDQMIRIYFIIPVKMKWLAWVYFGLTLTGITLGVVTMITGLATGSGLYLDWLLPIVALMNYFLFFGSNVKDVMPDFIRYRKKKPAKAKQAAPKTTFRGGGSAGGARFRCTVCGRTELTNPELEFRYCSKCSGYRCYCQDHINNHAHITDISE